MSNSFEFDNLPVSRPSNHRKDSYPTELPFTGRNPFARADSEDGIERPVAQTTTPSVAPWHTTTDQQRVHGITSFPQASSFQPPSQYLSQGTAAAGGYDPPSRYDWGYTPPTGDAYATPYRPTGDYSNNQHADFSRPKDPTTYTIRQAPPAPFSNPFNTPPQTPFGDEYAAQPPGGDEPRRSRFTLFDRLPARVAYFTYFVTLIQVGVFIAELVRMSQETGSPIQTKPTFNPMIGPSPYIQINMGARFTPCMHYYAGLTDDPLLLFPCPNSTVTATETCTLSELCGMSAFTTPNQWYRLVIPMFLHAGFLHIAFNLFLQLTMGAEVERTIGIARYAVLYLALGISGFLLGANFSTSGIASTGASGALFGIIVVNLLMFVFAGSKGRNQYNTTHYKFFLFTIVGEIIVSLFLGLLPGLDNFSHLGGAVQGLLLGVVMLKDPHFVYQKEHLQNNRYDINHNKTTVIGKIFGTTFSFDPRLELKTKKRFYWWMAVRVVCLALSIAYFAALGQNFGKYGGGKCSWCKYFNCIPVNGWCEIGEVTGN